MNDIHAGDDAPVGAFDLREYAAEIFSRVPGVAAFTYDREFRIRAALGAGLQRGGVEPDTLAGQHLADVLPAWSQVKGEYEAALAGDPRSFGCPSLQGIPYVTQISPLVSGDAVVGGLVVFRDASREETVGSPVVAPEPAGLREARRAEALKLARIGTWEVDLATGETRWSEESHAVYGVASGQFVADLATFEAITHPQDRHIVTDALERIVRDGLTFEIRYRIIRPSDGAERVIRSHVRSQLDADGHPVRLVGTGEDVTDLVLVLTPRESEILMMLAEGLSVEEIADTLFLSPATVRTHIHNAMVKLGAHTRGHAIATALRAGEIAS